MAERCGIDFSVSQLAIVGESALSCGGQTGGREGVMEGGREGGKEGEIEGGTLSLSVHTLIVTSLHCTPQEVHDPGLRQQHQ